VIRRASTIVLALVAIAAPAWAQSARTDSLSSALEGTVSGRFEGRSRPLPFALVEALAPGYGRAAVADSLGRYTIPDLPAGEVRVRVTHAGHDPVTLTVWLPPQASTRVDLELRTVPVELPPVSVSGEHGAAPIETAGAVTDPAIAEIELEALEAMPGVGQPGLLDAVRSLPGNDPANATDVLYMRGSTTDLKLVLLNGVPVYTPFHVAGLMRSFEPSVLGRADLHVGGAPARYDGGLTHILDLETRKARTDRVRASGSVDFLSASAALETPLGGRAGAIVSGRSLHDLGRAPLGGARPYGYQDLLVSVDATPADGHQLSLSGFWNTESVRLDYDRIPGDAAWSNRAGSLRYGATVGGTRFDLTAGMSGYRADLPLQPTGEPDQPPPPAVLASAAIDRVRIVAEASRPVAGADITAGATFDRIDAAFDASRAGEDARGAASTATPGVFVEASGTVAPGVTLRAGVRADLFDKTSTRFAPRAALHWEVGPEALLSIAVGRYHQSTRTPDFELERTLVQEPDLGVGATPLLPVASADHVVLSLDQRLAGRVRLGLEGFFKRFDGLDATREETVRSSGIDVRVLTGGERGVLWLGYGLSWFWSTYDLSGRASDFAGRHLLSAGVSGSLWGPLRAEARVAYGAGLPYTSIPFRSASPGDQLLGDGAVPDEGPTLQTLSALSAPATSPILTGLEQEFLRVDLEVHAVIETHLGGRPWSIQPYLKVLNALDRRDALFYTYRAWQEADVRPLAERSLLPMLGVAFSF